MAGGGGHSGEEGVAEADKQPAFPAELRTAAKAKSPSFGQQKALIIHSEVAREERINPLAFIQGVPLSLFICF